VTATGVTTADIPFLWQFWDFDDFIFCVDTVDPRKVAAVEHHLRKARAALARALWGREVFLGIVMIDQAVLQGCRRRGPHRPTFVLCPLHSLGVLSASASFDFSRTPNSI
jgi:hypothetical protein